MDVLFSKKKVNHCIKDDTFHIRDTQELKFDFSAFSVC